MYRDTFQSIGVRGRYDLLTIERERERERETALQPYQQAQSQHERRVRQISRKTSLLGRGEKAPTPKISALLRKRPVLLRAKFVLTKDRKRPYYGHSCGKYTGRGLVVKRPGVLSKVQMLNLVLGWGSFPFFQSSRTQTIACECLDARPHHKIVLAATSSKRSTVLRYKQGTTNHAPPPHRDSDPKKGVLRGGARIVRA